jgi:NAD(P)-dependent dehydrogenase (short-subunit alcohol dehydrogenase family)
MTGHALVTGGQQGIGLGIAEALAAAGRRVTLAAELPEDAPAVRDALARLGPAARYRRHDLRDLDAVPALLDDAEAAFGPITTLVSNAGVPARARGDLLDVAPESFDFVLSVNLRGGFFLAQAVARRMLAAPSDAYRCLIFVTSVSAALASPERGEYCVSKAGAAMTAQLFALRLAAHGIGVFELRPGVVATAMTAGVREAYDARIASGLVPAGRWGEPADVASAVLPLVEGRLAFATGAVIPVDGGLSIPRL